MLVKVGNGRNVVLGSALSGKNTTKRAVKNPFPARKAEKFHPHCCILGRNLLYLCLNLIKRNIFQN